MRNYKIQPLVDSCKPLIVNSNKFFAKTEEINAECYKNTKSELKCFGVM